MLAVVVFKSSKKDKEGRPLVHRCTELSCSCLGNHYHGGICSHLLAVRMDAEQARRKMERRPKRTASKHDLTDAF